MKLYTTHVTALRRLLASPVTFTPGNPLSQLEVQEDGLLIRRIIGNGGIKLEFVSIGQGYWNTILQYRRWAGHRVGTIDYQHQGTCRFTDPFGEEAALAKGLVVSLLELGYQAATYQHDIVKNLSREDYWQGPTVRC